MPTNESIWAGIWGRIGFALIAAIAGAAYAVAFSLVIAFVLKKKVFILSLKIFSLVFGLAGLILGKSIMRAVESSVYPIYYIWGVLLSAMAIGSDGVLGKEAINIAPQKGAGLYLVLLGALSVLLCFFLW